MSTFVGIREAAAPAAKKAPTAEPKKQPTADKTRAELVEEAEDLGIEVPAKASKAQIQKLIDGAEVI